ncbi:MAG: hypothetical protein FK730_09360 [Asgard group archaeon]|nr:hypothetical protein [Asgard group archaeon]
MLEQNPENIDEALKEAIELFNKQKEYILNHILERSAVVPEVTIKKIASTHQIYEEIAKVIFVLEFEYNISQELSSNYYKYEIARLNKVNFQLPEVYSFLIRFAIEEGFWIKYLTTDLPSKLKHKMSKLITIDRSLFGDLEGNKEDSALYMIERTFLINEIIRPMLKIWVKEHQRSTYYDAAISNICMMNKKAKEKGEIIITELSNRLQSNIESLKEIISELDSKGWAQKAIADFNELQNNLEKCFTKPTIMNWRIAAELILESLLIMEYDALELELDFSKNEKSAIKKEPAIKTNQGFEAKKNELIEDKITMTILKLDTLSHESQQEVIHELVMEEFNEATKYKRQKPTIFAKEFLTRILDELAIETKTSKKVMKKFDSALMYRLSPMGVKENPNLSVDEKVIQLLEETINENLSKRMKLLEEISQEELPQKIFENEQTKAKLSEKVSEKVDFANTLREVPDKELWIIIRDAYLKELFDSNEEKLAGAKVLKKFSLELGLLLTESESVNIITQELMKKGLTAVGSNKEELDKNICKIILNQIKEQRQYQTKISSK